jgi:5-methylcytosine-specific restriction endonuclease McrA
MRPESSVRQIPKKGKVKLTGREYKSWHTAILERDQWKCRRCEGRRNLQVHHIIKRSTLRLDTMENGLTLCFECHEDVERNTVEVVGKDANGIITFRTKEST